MKFTDILAFAPIVAKLGMFLLDNYINKKGADAEGKALAGSLAEYLRSKGLTEVKSRWEAESQIDAGNAAWEAREKAKAETQKPKE